MTNAKGALWLIPNKLGDLSPGIFPSEAQKVAHIRHWIVESPGDCLPIAAQLSGERFPDHWVLEHGRLDPYFQKQIIDTWKQGLEIGLITDAGLPAVADPGSRIVAMAHQYSVPVLPLVGPSSLMLALMSSGLNGQRFRFLGYLEKNPDERKKQVQKLGPWIENSGETQMFIETPYRASAVLTDILRWVSPALMLCLAVDLHTHNQSIITRSIGQWKMNPPIFKKQEVVFLLGRF